MFAFLKIRCWYVRISDTSLLYLNYVQLSSMASSLFFVPGVKRGFSRPFTCCVHSENNF